MNGRIMKNGDYFTFLREHAESQIMPSYSLVPLCCSMPSTGCFSPSSA